MGKRETYWVELERCGPSMALRYHRDESSHSSMNGFVINFCGSDIVMHANQDVFFSLGSLTEPAVS